jgi:hypothetical protein
MIQNKRGLSDIVTTLVIILLSLIAIAVVWVVVNSLIKSGTKNTEILAKCSNINLDFVSVKCNVEGNSCNVTLKKTGTTQNISGASLVFSNSSSSYSPDPIDYSGDLPNLVPKLIVETGADSVLNSGINNPDKIQVTPYFKDTSNNQYDCSTYSFDFTAS